MSLTKALGDANAAPGNPNRDENTGPSEAGYLGYTQMPFASQMPARSNADVSNTANLGSINAVNQGTSAPSYDNQEELVSAEDGGGDNQSTSGK